VTEPQSAQASAVSLGILVVHDDPATLYWLQRVLSHAGYRVASDSSLFEALHRTRNDPTIRLLIADWHLGDQDAAALVLEARRNDPAFPILVVTAISDRTTRIKQRLPQDVEVLDSSTGDAPLLATVERLWQRVRVGAAEVLPGATPPTAVLVVEDDEYVLQYAMRVLSGEGYVVLDARDGAQALTLLDHLTTPVQLVLTDVRMPVMSGRTLGNHLAARYPELPVLYMTGDEGGSDSEQQPLTPMLRKPFTADSLRETVRALLYEHR
jgi:CheY-like chemotaxis protein